MDRLSLSEIAAATGGKLFAPPSLESTIISRVVTDSRTFFKGDDAVFFALTGPVNNGHDYIPQLIEKGLQAYVVSDRSAISDKAAFILVGNTTRALQDLAAANRKRYNYPVIGITGSNGKTIVKEWLHDVLSDEFRIVRSPRSYNSQIGVPLSVLLMTAGYDLAIFEAGISKPGEMERLEKIVSPDIGILTNIGDAHQENFDSLEQKLNEKLLLFKNSQKLVCRTDDPMTERVTRAFCDAHGIERISWTLDGNGAHIRFYPEIISTGCSIKAVCGNQQYDFEIPFSNDSAIENACLCFATALALKADRKKTTAGFGKLQPLAMRLEIKQGINDCLLINDYYNSDLNSLTIALSVLKQQAASGKLSKQVILSDIQQTGLPKAELYQKVNGLLEEWQIDKLTGIGPDIFAHRNRFTVAGEFYPNRTAFENGFSRNKFRASAILIKGARQFEFEKISGLLQQKAHQTVLEIDMNALVDNLNVFRRLLKPRTKIMVMVKAFSYGSGDVEIARLLEYRKVDYLAVAVADEGVQLRNAGIATPIIVMNPEQDSFQNIIDYRLEPNIYSVELLTAFSKTVSANGLQHFPVHLKIDTGMNRLGLKSGEEIDKAIFHLQTDDALRVRSVFSHLAASDEPSLDGFTRAQFEKFEQHFQTIASRFSYPIDRHILNSAGIERFPEKQYEMVRLGIGLYGVSATGLPLRNIGKLKSTVSQVKTVSADETVGYSRKGEVKKTSRIAIVPLGYADGLDRKLGNRNGFAFVRGHRVPIIGNICMDMLMLDVTGLEVQAGDSVEFFGENIPVTELAERAGTIPYEILTGISQRVKRVYLQE